MTNDERERQLMEFEPDPERRAQLREILRRQDEGVEAKRQMQLRREFMPLYLRAVDDAETEAYKLQDQGLNIDETERLLFDNFQDVVGLVRQRRSLRFVHAGTRALAVATTAGARRGKAAGIDAAISKLNEADRFAINFTRMVLRSAGWSRDDLYET
jgi:hypothetical protein